MADEQSSNTEKFTMTWEWLHRFSTPGGGWTAKQLRVIGVDWPPVKGWLTRSIGVPISQEQRCEFEHLHDERQAYLAANHQRGHRVSRHSDVMSASQNGKKITITIEVK